MGLEIKPFESALFITIPYCSTPPMILPITSLLWAPRGCWRRTGLGFKVWELGCRRLPRCEALPTVKPTFWVWEPSSKRLEKANKNRSGGRLSWNHACNTVSGISKMRGGFIYTDVSAEQRTELRCSSSCCFFPVRSSS